MGRLRTCVPLTLAALLASAGCNVGSTGDGTNSDIDPGPGPEPGARQIELVCSATLAITGDLTPPGTPPGPDAGCEPAGIWSLSVTLDDVGDCNESDIEFNDTYEYEVTLEAADPEGDVVNEVMVYLGDDGNPEEDSYNPARSGGTCRANLTHYNDDLLKVVYLQPFEDDLIITGSGTFELWAPVE